MDIFCNKITLLNDYIYDYYVIFMGCPLGGYSSFGYSYS